MLTSCNSEKEGEMIFFRYIKLYDRCKTFNIYIFLLTVVLLLGLQLRSHCGLQLLYRESGKMLVGMGSLSWGVNPGSVRPLWGLRKTEGCKSSNALSVQSPLELCRNQVYLAVTKMVQWR